MNGILSKETLPGHHKKLDYCLTRKAYRNGRRRTAIKVFTVNSESKFIIVTNVHATGLANDLVKTFSKFGTVVQCDELADYPNEPFTQTFLLKYEDMHSARKAKRKGDEMYFFGSTLHVFYAPEHETVEDVREKLTERRSNVLQRVKFLDKESRRVGVKSGSDASKAIHSDTTSTERNTTVSHLPGFSGTYQNLTSSNIQPAINPCLPHRPILLPHRKRSYEQDCGDLTTRRSNEASSLKKDWKPPKKKPRLLRLPGYIPPTNASSSADVITER